MLRGVLVLAAASLALPFASGSAASSETTTVSCKQAWTFFNVQLIGDRDWGWNLASLARVGIPKRKAVIVVWSMGGTGFGGLNAYSWATATRSRPSPRCSRVHAALEPASLEGLGPVTRVEDGWALGRKFACLERGPILITTSRTPARTRVVVRMQASGRVMAVGELGRGGGWIRGSKRCDDAEK